MLAKYDQLKSTVLDCAGKLLAYEQAKGNPFARDLIKTSMQRLQRECFTLVVLGEFKRGKSTFINALLGEEVMPCALVPLTAIPTLVRHGEKPGAKVLFQDGSVKEIALTDIQDYVTERHNPANMKKVRQVEIDYPALCLKEGMILVDTPGVGSVYRHNTESAYGYLPYADVAVFMISVDVPLSQSEIDYIKNIQGHVKHIFFVLNKIDKLDQSELQEVLDYTQNVLIQSLGKNTADLIPISAKDALKSRQNNDGVKFKQSGLDRLEEQLGAFIRDSRGELILAQASGRLLRIINEEQTALNLWRRAMDDTAEGLNEKISRFDAALKELEQEREDGIFLLYHEVDRLAAKISEDMADFYRKALPALTAQLSEHAGGIVSGHSARHAAALLHDLTISQVTAALENKKEEEWHEVKELFNGVAERFFNKIEAIVDRMMEKAAQIFELQFDSSARREYVLGDRQVFFHFYDHPTFIPNLTDLSLFEIVPASLARGHILKKAKENLAELLDRNCGRVRYNLAEGLKESARNVAGDLRLRVEAVAGGLRLSLQQAVDQRTADHAARMQTIRSWEKNMALLSGLKAALDEGFSPPRP